MIQKKIVKRTLNIFLLIAVILLIVMNIYPNPKFINYGDTLDDFLRKWVTSNNNIEFYEEEVNLFLTSTEWYVDGLYTFRNTNPTELACVWLEYPVAGFSWGNSVNNPDRLEFPPVKTDLNFTLVDDLGDPIPRQERRDGYFVAVNSKTFLQAGEEGAVLGIPGGDKATIRIQYSLPIPKKPSKDIISRISELVKIRSNPAIAYYVTTALTWGKPISRASFKLTVGKGVELNHMPYENPEVIVSSKNIEYHWMFENFVPSEDFIVDFRYRN